MLRLLARPLASTLLLVLPALLLERLLRLFDLLAGAGSPASSIVQLLIYLVPHYLGLAVPAALFLAVYVVVARLSQDHEMDALQASGFSLARLSWPFLAVGLLCAGLSAGLYGYVQPLSRYAYRAAFHAITNAGWNASLVPGEFVRINRQLTVYVDRHDRARNGTGNETRNGPRNRSQDGANAGAQEGPRNGPDGLLHGVLLHQRQPDGREVLTTAATGWLLVSPEESELLMALEEGQQITLDPDGAASTLGFANSAQSRPFVRRLPLYRLRGTDEREMTLDELWAARNLPDPPVARARLDGELHGRLVRSASLLFLPLLAMPMGLAAKRSRRSAGILLGAVILVVYQQALQLIESLGDVGRLDPRPALWALLLLFALLSAAVFHHSNRNPEEGAFDGVLARLDAAVAAVAARFRRRPAPR